MKKLLAMAFALSGLLLFVSCDEDDDAIGDGTDNSGGSGIVVTIPAGELTTDASWSADSIYLLAGRVTVPADVTLTIAAGTIIKGQAGTGANASALLVARNGTLNAMGTAESPIIFTSAADNITVGQTASPNLDPSISGLWGGVIILGNAPGSFDDDASEIQIEGIPTSDPNGLYGGTDPADNSGTITYISIRHGGSNIGQGNEINGLTLGSVGNGTTINGVEIVANADDGIEWFGGTVDVSTVLVWNSNDDGLDTDQDWVGTCSDFVIVTPQGGSAFELDGPEGTGKVNSATADFHTFSNGVVYAGDAIDHLVDWDGSTNASITGMYFYGLDVRYLDGTSSEIESFEGDGSGTSTDWEVTMPGTEGTEFIIDETTFTLESAASAFGDASGIITDLTTGTGTTNARTNGPAATAFSWTWAAESGALNDIGL